MNKHRGSVVPDRVVVRRHQATGRPPCLRIAWYSDGQWVASEYVTLFYTGYAQRKACRWWFLVVGGDLPGDIDEAVERAAAMQLPRSISVDRSGSHPQVTWISKEKQSRLESVQS